MLNVFGLVGVMTKLLLKTIIKAMHIIYNHNICSDLQSQYNNNFLSNHIYNTNGIVVLGNMPKNNLVMEISSIVKTKPMSIHE